MVQVGCGFATTGALVRRTGRGLGATPAPGDNHLKKLVVCWGGEDDSDPSAQATPERAKTSAAARTKVRRELFISTGLLWPTTTAPAKFNERIPLAHGDVFSKYCVIVGAVRPKTGEYWNTKH